MVCINVQKKLAPDYANTAITIWLGDLYACGAVGEAVADLERAGKRHAVITGVVEGGDPEVAAQIADWCKMCIRDRYWGECTSFDQRFVEMAAISYGIMFAPEVVWDCLLYTSSLSQHLKTLVFIVSVPCL